MKRVFYLIILLVFFSCNDKKERVPEYKKIGDFSSILDEEDMKKLERIAIDSNNVKVYNELQGRRLRTNYEYQMHLNTAIQMANRNDYDGAYFDVFNILSNSTTDDNRNFERLDYKTKCLALYYLLKAYEKRDVRSEIAVKEIFKSQSIPSANFYLIEMTKE